MTDKSNCEARSCGQGMAGNLSLRHGREVIFPHLSGESC